MSVNYVPLVLNTAAQHEFCGWPVFNMAKSLRSRRAATRVALDAIQILVGNGYVNEYPTGRLLRDAKLYEIGAGTSEIRRMLIGRELFRETA
jgi:alkylation response protein AidB-like acyl-CoA dehydrogenase